MTARPREDMPAAVADALSRRGLKSAYDARPAYQRNDYLLWIRQAKREDTRRRRLEQMLTELEQGDRYMRMPWRAGRARQDAWDRRQSP